MTFTRDITGKCYEVSDSDELEYETEYEEEYEPEYDEMLDALTDIVSSEITKKVNGLTPKQKELIKNNTREFLSQLDDLDYIGDYYHSELEGYFS